jgi:hypothetical protein
MGKGGFLHLLLGVIDFFTSGVHGILKLARATLSFCTTAQQQNLFSRDQDLQSISDSVFRPKGYTYRFNQMNS